MELSQRLNCLAGPSLFLISVRPTALSSLISLYDVIPSIVGSVGGTYAVPVLVVPQVIIGAFGRLQVLPRYLDRNGNPATVEQIEDGEATVSPSTLMNVSWSADHRVIDGATVAKFSNLWKHYLENPHVMLSELR